MNDATDIAQSLISQPMMAAAVVCVGAMSILKIVNEFIRLRETLSPKPAPQEVQDEARAAGHGLSERVTELDGRVSMEVSARQAFQERVDAHERELAAVRDRESLCAGKLHKRIDELALMVSHNGGRLDEGMIHITASLTEIRNIVLSNHKAK
jgi:hypothetical protein